MRRRQSESVERVRRHLALARGASRARLDAARDALARAEGDLAELTTRHPQHTVDLRELRALARSASPGLASARWEDWPADPTEALTGTRPGPRNGPQNGANDSPHNGPWLYRVGSAQVGADTLPVLLPLLDRSHLLVSATAAGQGRAEDLVSGLLLRMLATVPPGMLHLYVHDPEGLGATFAGFTPLAPAGLWTSTGPNGLTELLGDLVGHVRRVNERVLAGRYRSLAERAAATGERREPWRVAVLLAGRSRLTVEQQANVERLLHTGAACGVHLVGCGIAVPDWALADAPVETVAFTDDGGHTSLTGPRRELRADPPPLPELLQAVCQTVADRVLVGPAPADFADLLPDELWTESSASGLTAPVGDQNGEPVFVTLGDSPPHALVGGPTGSGKTNFLYVLIGSLAARYGPDELEFYLLDFKEGVSFARFARGRRDPSWLPHARLVGINVNEDREFGLALLRFLAEQMRVRAEAARRHEATKLEELRAEDPTGRWPRIVAVIDEFQYLFHQRDKVSTEAVALLEDLARRGRSQGIHLILSSQDTSGIAALWGHSAIVAQFTQRVALPRARRVLAEDNPQANLIPRWHAVINPESGVRTGNQVARLPDAGRGGLDALQTRLWQHRAAGTAEPRLFDGDVVPGLADSADFDGLTPGGRRSPVALVGQLIDVAGSAATVRLSRTPGRNCAVIGTRVTETCDVLTSMALSLARQHEPGGASFDIACLDEDAVEVADRLHLRLRRDGHQASWHDLDDIRPLLASAAADVEAAIIDGQRTRPRYLIMFAVDVANALLEVKDPQTRRSGLDNLRQVVRRGPEVRTHLLGWWRTVARLKEDLAGIGGRLEDVGAWLALDVQGAELSPLPGGQLLNWSPRLRRALFFDRTVHSRPRPVIPFDTMSCLDGIGGIGGMTGGTDGTDGTRGTGLARQEVGR